MNRGGVLPQRHVETAGARRAVDCLDGVVQSPHLEIRPRQRMLGDDVVTHRRDVLGKGHRLWKFAIVLREKKGEQRFSL